MVKTHPSVHPYDAAVAFDDDRMPFWWYARLVRRLCPAGGRLLEVGCGAGQLLRRLSAHYEVFGYDPVAAVRSRSRSAVPDAVILEDWNALPPASLDMIVSLRTLEQIARPLPTMQGLTSKLTAGGFLLLTVPNPGGLGRRLKGRSWFAYRQSAQLSLLTHGEWVMLLRKVGLEIVSVCGDGLWDAPYVGLVPTAVQRVLFAVPATVQMFWPLGGPMLPAVIGERLIITARRPA